MKSKSIWKVLGATLVAAVMVAGIVAATPLLVTDVIGVYNGITEVWVDDDFTPDTAGWGITHFDKIQDGIDAVNGSTVHVADGVYTPIRPGEYQGHILIDSRNGLELLGSGAATTIIQGDYSTCAVWVVNSSDILIRGFTITNGGQFMHDEGGGIHAVGSTLTVENCMITNNEAVNGGAVRGEGDSNVDIVNSVIVRNRAENISGAVIGNGSIISSTIANNVGGYEDLGGVGEAGGSLIVTNCILWGNGDDIIGAGTIATYSDIEDGDLGEGNTSADPLFVDAAGDDYHLQTCSSCIDAGTNTGAPVEDIEGNSRPIDGDGDSVDTTDMGAYEFVPCSEYFFDDFNDEVDDGWGAEYGEWAVTAGEYTAIGDDPAPMSSISGYEFDVFTLNASLRINSGGAAQIGLRVQDLCETGVAHVDNGIVLVIFPGGNSTYWHVVTDGVGAPVNLQALDITISEEEPLDVRVEVFGDTYKAYINGELKNTLIDSTYHGGKIVVGINLTYPTPATWDNIEVICGGFDS